MIKRIHRRGIAAVPIMFVLAACGGGAASPSPAASQPGGTGGPAPTGGTGVVDGGVEEVCAAGATEGTLVYWNNLAFPDEVIAAFNEAYPDIAVEPTTLRPDESAQRVLTEASTPNGVSADLIYGGLDVFEPVLERGLVDQDIDWEALGAAEDTIAEGMVRIYRVAGGLGYNTDEVTPEELPNTWEELIDEQWAGQVVVDPRGRPFDQLSLSWGEEQTLDYVNRLKEIVQPTVIEGGTAGMQSVAGGEHLITTGGRSAETLEQQAEGAPIDIKYLDVVPTLDAYHAVVTGAAHPNAAACWVAWTAGPGKATHDEIEFKSNDTVPPGAPEGAEILAIDTPEKATTVSEMSETIGAIWTE